MNPQSLSCRTSLPRAGSKEQILRKKINGIGNKISLLNLSKEKNKKFTSNFLLFHNHFVPVSTRNQSKPKMLPSKINSHLIEKEVKNPAKHSQLDITKKLSTQNNNFMMFLKQVDTINKAANISSHRTAISNNPINKLNFCTQAEDYIASVPNMSNFPTFSKGLNINTSSSLNPSKSTLAKTDTTSRPESQMRSKNILVKNAPQKNIENNKKNILGCFSKKFFIFTNSNNKPGKNHADFTFKKIKIDSCGTKKAITQTSNLQKPNKSNLCQKSDAILIKNFQKNKVIPNNNKNSNKMFPGLLSNSLEVHFPEHNLTSNIYDHMVTTTSQANDRHQANPPVTKEDFEDDSNDTFEDCQDQSEVKEASGVLTYDEVKDIIVCYDFKNIESDDRCLFYPNDYELFIQNKKKKYMDLLFPVCNLEVNVNSNINHIDLVNKSTSTKDSSSNKKNTSSVIKYS